MVVLSSLLISLCASPCCCFHCHHLFVSVIGQLIAAFQQKMFLLLLVIRLLLVMFLLADLTLTLTPMPTPMPMPKPKPMPSNTDATVHAPFQNQLIVDFIYFFFAASVVCSCAATNASCLLKKVHLPFPLQSFP